MRTFALALALSFVTLPAEAQVNAEVLRPGPVRAGWSGGADGTLAYARGNIDLTDFGGAGRVTWQSLHPQVGPGPARFAQRVFLSANGRRAERAGTPFIDQGFVHLRWTAMWHPRVGTDVFVQHQGNAFLRQQARTLAGGGLRWDLVHTVALMIWGGSGVMVERDRVRVAPGAADDPVTVDLRGTTYLAVRLALLDQRLFLQATSYLQPLLGDLRDVRTLQAFEVLSRVNETFALGATLDLLRDSRPPTGVVANDTRLATMVRVSF